MSRKRKILAVICAILLVLVIASVAFAEGEEAEYQSNAYATIWSLLPPVVAIVLALITKEVYSSLFVGILAGALLYANFNLEVAYTTIFTEGFVAKLADSWNVGILIFLVILGTIVVMMNRAGGAAAFGNWAKTHVKTRVGAELATFVLGIIIFVDDYFNCLTVGSVMRPICDSKNVSRAKFAYLIDATAAPICMIAPISSWAAAVTGVIEGYDGLELFINAIPYNLYSLLTIFMVLFVVIKRIDFGPMRIHENNALKGDLYTTAARPYANATDEEVSSRGRVIDLIIPVIILIVLCVFGMVYTGGFFAGTSFVEAFANCDASLGLALGSGLALIVIFIYYLCRRVLTFKQCMAAIPEGFKAMVPAILILTFAWTLSAMTGLLGADVFVSGIFERSAGTLQMFLPVIVFIVAIGLAFATGTSWGTFGILLPLVVAVSHTLSGNLLVIAISACLAGAVCGDHCSPISDTTIMASTGAQCDHVNHVSTQLPYALFVAIISAIGYVLLGVTQNPWITYVVALVLIVGILLLVDRRYKKKENAVKAE